MSEIVKNIHVLLLDIEGTTTSISFVKDKLFPYAEEKVHQYLDTQWDKDDVKEAVAGLRKLALEDQKKSVEGFVQIPAEDASKEDQLVGLVNNVKWQMSLDRKNGALKVLQGLIWKQGYDNGDIKGHVYDDVLPALQQWRSVDGRKVYIYSSGSVQAQKLLFGQSVAGNLLEHIDGHFDTTVGGKREAESYKKIVEQIGCKPEEILFLTDIYEEAAAARAADVRAALLERAGNAALPAAAAALPRFDSFEALLSNKRRADSQEEEQQPAKVAKTSAEDDVKTSSSEAASEKSSEDTETMEVDETPKPDTNGDTKENGSIKDAPSKVETTVEEITDSNDTNLPVLDIEPIVEEKVEHMEEDVPEVKETADDIKTETSTGDNGVNKDNVENGATPEETPPVVVPEIEVSEKLSPVDDNEAIVDIEPVIEEPESMEAEIKELQNVGEELEKECDDLLSKVNSVTNIDNISVKPLLTPVLEEDATENDDSNDIVNSILDKELELELKQNEKSDETNKENVEKTEDENDDKAAPSITVTPADNNKDTETDEKIVQNEETAPEQTETRLEEAQTKEVETDSKPNDEQKVNETSMETANTEKDTNEKSMETTTNETSSTATDEQKTKETIAETAANEQKANETSAETATNEQKINETISETTKIEQKTNETISETATNEQKTNETSAETVTIEQKTNEKSAETVAQTVTKEEPHVNGKSNSEAKENLNGNAKEEELEARLSLENGKETTNGSSDVKEVEDNGDVKSDVDMTEIKVKAVPTEDTRSDPIEQATEA